MKWIGRLFVAILILSGVFYFFKPPDVENTDKKIPATQIERTIESQEDSLTRIARIQRLFNFQDEVEQALYKRVPKESFVPSSGISRELKLALVATEDKRYYEHGAVDPFSIVRAFYTNTIAGETQEGGSTITQQLVKNLFLSSKRIMSRKIEEVILAMMMEHYYSKDEILTMYLNSIYYGNNFYGIKAASEGYFNTEPDKLTLGQAAMLAGMPQAPSYYNPIVNLSAAKARQRTVLDLMVAQDIINKQTAAKAYGSSLHIQK